VRYPAKFILTSALWFEQDGQASNPIWLSLNSSHVVAATDQEVVKNMDGLTT
jgi:hypothetical protein